MTENSRFIRVHLFAALMGLLVSMTAPSQAATWYVRPAGGIGSGTSWGDALGSFQAAINSASAGDEIWGASGVYNESLTLKAGIALYGGFAGTETSREDRDFAANPTILDATGLNRRVITANRSEGVTIDGFTIRNGNSSPTGGGILFFNVQSATVSNCTISGNTTDHDGGGVYCGEYSSPTLSNCTISGNTARDGGGGVACFSHSSTSPKLIHCTISGNTARNGGGVHSRSYPSLTLTNCTISGNTANRDGGGVFCDRSSPWLTNCTIAANTAGTNGGGVICSSNSSPSLTNCTVTGNTAGSNGGGVYCTQSSPRLTHCTISGNTANRHGSGVYSGGSAPTLTNCILWNPGNEIFWGSGALVVRYSCVQRGYPGEGNVDAYPQFVDPLNGDWRLRDGSPCIDRGADVGLPFSGAGPDMGSWEAPETYSQGDPHPILSRRFHVDAGASKGGNGLTWESAFSSVGEALLHSSTADEIWVAAGSYNESIHMERGLALYGGFAGTESMREDRDSASNPTILDAKGTNQRVITAVRSEGVTIDGFTIRDGNSWAGGGIYFENVSSATVSNCTISDNTTDADGGGLYCLASSPTLTNCTISGNTTAGYGGGLSCLASSPTLANCTISGNRANRDGGGVFCDGSSPTLTNCTISANASGTSGGGLAFSYSSSATLFHCTISNNSAHRDGGGLHCGGSSPTLTNCMISNNSAHRDGGGMYCGGSSPTLTNCTITGNTAVGNGGGAHCSGSSPTLIHGTITGNRATSAGGGVYCWTASPTLTHCTISGNTAMSDGGGLACLSSSKPTLTHCMISDNTAISDGGGVACFSFSSPNLTHCTISGNSGSSGSGLHCDRSPPKLTNCILWNPGSELFVVSGTPLVRFSCVQGSYPGEGNIEANPLFVDPLNGDWRLQDGSPCIDRGADIGLPFNGEAPDMGSWEAPETYSQGPPNPGPQRFYVDADASKGGNGLTWETAFTSVGEAWLHSSTADEIWVAAGTYNESITMNTGLALYGGFAAVETVREQRDFVANPTILDATGLNQRVITADRSKGVTIDGFTIRNGNSTGQGGGVYFNNVSSATVANCTISSNTASFGGGVYCSGSSPTLTNCTITGNTANYGGSGIYVSGSSSSPSLTHCTISGNTADEDGGGVYCSYSTPTLTHCTISGNTANRFAGGVYCDGSSPTLTHCTISGNRASSGGGVHSSSSSPTLLHCTISDNTANNVGGGGYCSSSSPTLTHCTISGNTANNGGGGMYVSGSSSSPSLTNCILWNPGNEISVDSGAPMVRYSSVQEGYPGESNIDAYPLFVDPLNGDWRLRDGSPCIDRGREVGLPFNGAGPDMGSWEAPESYSQGPPDHVPQLFRVDHAALPGGDGHSWVTAFSTVGEALLHSSTADEIWVASGTYNESITMNTGLALYGGFAAWETVREDRDSASNPTILDATGLNQRVITADETEGVTIDGFTIRNGNPMEPGGGIYFYSVSSATVSNCIVSGNRAMGVGGGVFCKSSSLTLTHCTISGNTATSGGHGGGVCFFSSSPTLTHCTISGNRASSGGGVYCSFSSPTLTHCTISGNTVSSNGGGGVYCSFSSPILTHCTISNNTVPGTPLTGGVGGGVFCSDSSPTLTHCTISGNTTGSNGGGVYCWASSPTLIHCTITGNLAKRDGGGVYCGESSSPTLTRCTISANTADRYSGGGVACFSSSPSLTHCTISDNTTSSSGGGLAFISSSPTLTHCTISGNTAKNDGGGVYSGGSLPTLTNCTISGNDTNRRGGGVHCNNSSASLTNCTITGNTAASGGGMASLTTSSPALINCILWNGGDEVFLESATAEITFSAVQGGYPGQGNIDEDPMFVDPEQSDYRLAMGSSCIDSGSSGAVLRLGPSQLAMGDHLGRMRIWDGDSDGFAAVDMGAYEFGPPPFVGDLFGDSRVNHLDLFRFQQVWKEEGEGVLPAADQDGDRTIGASDLVILLNAWGNVTGP